MIYLHAYIDAQYIVYSVHTHSISMSQVYRFQNTHNHHADVWVGMYCEYTEIFISSSSISITERFIGLIRLRKMLIYILFFIIPISKRTDVLTDSNIFIFVHISNDSMISLIVWKINFSIFPLCACVEMIFLFLHFFRFSISFCCCCCCCQFSFASCFFSLPIRECVIYLNNVDVCASICFK